VKKTDSKLTSKQRIRNPGREERLVDFLLWIDPFSASQR